MTRQPVNIEDVAARAQQLVDDRMKAVREYADTVTASAVARERMDSAGSVTATALASTMAAGALATVAFTKPKTTAPRAVLLSDRSAANADLYVSAKTGTSFTISTRSARSASQAIIVDYAVID